VPKKPKRVREQVVVYLDRQDRALLEQMAEETGLAKTELFRRGLRRLAEEALQAKKPGSSLAYLISTATPDPFPPDVSERHDHYLYDGGYGKPVTKRRARSG
jgi:hypothetical protein